MFLLLLFCLQGGLAMAQTDEAIRSTIIQTSEQNPVIIIAGKEEVSNNEAYIYIRLIIHPLYHIFAKVADEDPFIETEIKLGLPKGIKEIGKTLKPRSHYYSANGTRTYSGDIVFRQKIKGNITQPITVNIAYQVCDHHICFIPENKSIIIK